MQKRALVAEPLLIQDTIQLNEYVDRLLEQPVVGVDTESNSLYAYQERVCLIQFSTPNEDILIDPLAISDLSRLQLIFNHPHIRKVFHAAEYDLFCLHRDFGFEFQHLFDTMIAARILGRPQVGLGALLEREFGVRLDKRLQRANWGVRPLPPDLILYAQDDTRYLIPLSQRLEQELIKKELYPLAKEDFERLAAQNSKGKEKNCHEECWHVRGAYDLPVEKIPVLQELCQARDQIARRINQPLFKVISDQKMLQIADRAPTNLTQLRQLGCLSKHQLERHGAALVAAVQRGLRRPLLVPPRHLRPSDTYLAQLEALRQWRKSIAQQMNVPSDVILPREVMLRLVESPPETLEDLKQLMRDVPFRFERFGNQILAIFQSTP